jgi:hypothetical protein
MKLFEIFTAKSSTRVKWSNHRPDYVGYKTDIRGTFSTPNGEKIMIKWMQKDFDNFWEFHFTNAKTGKSPNEKGEQFFVFSTIASALRKLIKDKKPECVELFANTAKQLELYNVIIQKFKTEISGLGYRIEHDVQSILLMRNERNRIMEKRIVLDPSFHGDGTELVVWENPSYDELRKLIHQFGRLRATSSPDGPLYVWDAAMWTHHTIHKYLGYMPYYLFFSNTRDVNEEWVVKMRKRGDIFMGIKNGDADRHGLVVFENPFIKRAVFRT